MEYPFISRQTFDNLIKQYIEKLAPNKKEKALIDQEKLQKIKDVLLNHQNTTLYTPTFLFWAKSELDPLGVEEYPELDHISTDQVSVREAARNQSTGIVTCKCKSNCNTYRCHCKKAGVNCEVDAILEKCVITKFKINKMY